jgi:glycosyltransferase involved in cell wall biosynthesis
MHLAQLAESLIDLGHSPIIVTPQWKRSWPQQMIIGRISIVRLRGSARGGWSTLRWMYSLGSWLRDAAVTAEAVLVTGMKQEAYVALGAAHRTGRPTILIAEEDDLAWQRTATLGSRVHDRCSSAQAIIASSGELSEALVGAGFVRQCITTIPRTAAIPPPQNPKGREQARSALATANYDLLTTASTQVALAIGRLEPANRFSDLVRAWRIVTARKPEARLWIVGDGPERERLYRQIGDLDQRFRAMLPGTFDCWHDLYSASDMLLAPAAHLTPPLVMLQAQAAGLPVIAADAAAIRPHIRHQKTGLLFPAGDFKALAAAVLELMEHRATAVRYGAAGRAAAQAATPPHQEAQAYVDLLKQTLA